MKPELTTVRGIGPSTARALEAQGIRSVPDLAKASADMVVATPGFGEVRAAEVIAAAAALLAAAGEAQAPTKKAAASKPKKKAALNPSKPKGKKKSEKKKDKKAKKKKKAKKGKKKK